MNKERLLKYSLYAAGIIALSAFIITRNEDLLDTVTEDSYRHGDLYRLALVSDFKIDIPDRCEPDVSNRVFDGQRIIFIGDSFAEACRGHEPLPQMISKSLGEPVYHVLGNETPEYFNPILLYREAQIGINKKRLIILERVERYISKTFSDELDLNPVRGNSSESFGEKIKTIGSKWFSTHDEELYQFLLKSSDLSRPIVELWSTAMFHLLNKIAPETPVYSLQPPFLFYFDETDSLESSSYYSPHPDSLIEIIASTISELHDELADKYNAELIFMPVPSKYTLYHSIVNNDPYDNYLPRLTKSLELKGVRTVDLYSLFAKSKDTLYFPTDTHWNAKGATLALQETMRTLKRSDYRN